MGKTSLRVLLVSTLFLGACGGEFGSSYFAPTAALVCGEISCTKIPESRIAEQLSVIMEDDETAKPFRGPGSAASRVDAQREILSNLIRDEVALQKARTMRITERNAKPAADAKLKEIKAQFQSEKAFQDQLKNEGLTLPRLEALLLQEEVLKKVQDQVGRGSEATPAEIEEFYQLNKSQYDAQVNVSHILICGELNQQERRCNLKPEDNARAAEALRRARAGENFGSLAREYSADETSRIKDGEIGFVSRGDLVPELEEAAFNLLSVGDISDPIKTQFGLHIVKLNAIGKPLDVARGDIEKGLTQRKLTRAFDEWLIASIKASRIKVNPKIGKYDPIAQVVVPLDAEEEKAPAAAPSPQPTASPPEIPDPPTAPEQGIPPAPDAPPAP
jgi:parvulin-like peptidyl-prolyl isomerase